MPMVQRRQEGSHASLNSLPLSRGPGAGTGNQIIGLGGNRPRDLGPQGLCPGFCLCPGHLFQCASENNRFARHRRTGCVGRFHRFHVELIRQTQDRSTFFRRSEGRDQRLCHHMPDPVDGQ